VFLVEVAATLIRLVSLILFTARGASLLLLLLLTRILAIMAFVPAITLIPIVCHEHFS
jgi:hypothetical protein